MVYFDLRPVRKHTYFISDLHLGAKYVSDPREHEAAVAEFLHAIAPTARRLYILGDALDYWFEYRTVVPRGYVRFFGALAQLADSGTEIVWFTGNHDIWLFDYLRDEIGMQVVDPKNGYELVDVDGTFFCLGHGDGIGHRSPGFRFIRSIFRCRFLQKLFSGIHPRWTIPFAHGWSHHSRKGTENPQSLAPRARAGLEVFARQMSHDNPELRYVVVGHHHVRVDEPINDHCRIVVLGDWLWHHTYGVFDGSDFKLKEYQRGENFEP